MPPEPMRLAVTGGTGLVGRFIVEAALAGGWQVTVMGRRAPPADLFSAPVDWAPLDLTDAARPPLRGHAGLVHAAFDHVPGRYRGGEGDDPDGFRRRNLDGTLRLFGAARRAGIGRVVFLSSRAVFGGLPPGTRLTEDMNPSPDTLYGQVKYEAEEGLRALSAPSFVGNSLRATGIYGPAGKGQSHKWADLFHAFLDGAEIAPRIGTELHGADLAEAVLRLLHADAAGGVAHASDLLLDRRDLLAAVARCTGATVPLPQPAADAVSALACDRLAALGWRPGGMARLEAELPLMLAQAGLCPDLAADRAPDRAMGHASDRATD